MNKGIKTKATDQRKCK